MGGSRSSAITKEVEGSSHAKYAEMTPTRFPFLECDVAMF